MKHLRKSILTLLALTLFGGAGAWAQGPTQVTQFTTDLIASWQNDNSDVTLADMQALGFVAVDENTAMAWTGAPQGNNAWLIYSFNEGDGNINIIKFTNGTADDHSGQGSFAKGGFYDIIASDTKFFYTTGGGAIELTKEGANQWSLGQTPDYDLELQVEYYEAHALKNIPAGWQVKVNGVDKTAAIDGDSLLITETDSVTLIPAGNPHRVKSVTLEDEGPAAQTITIGGITLDITDCTFWSDIIDRNPGLIWEFNGIVQSNEGMLLLGSSDAVFTPTPYDPAQQSNYHWVK